MVEKSRTMAKKAIIVISLVEESVKKIDMEIEEEIVEELSTGLPKISWLKRVEKSRDEGLKSDLSTYRICLKQISEVCRLTVE